MSIEPAPERHTAASEESIFTAYALTQVADAAERLSVPSCTISLDEKVERLSETIARVLREVPESVDEQVVKDLAEAAVREVIHCGVDPECIRTDASRLTAV